VDGDNQSIPAGRVLTTAFAVRVATVADEPVPKVRVDWHLASGAGDFLGRRGNRWEVLAAHERFTVTDRDGIARVSFLPSAAGTSTVTASLADQAITSPAFTVHVSPPITTVINFGPLFDCSGPPSDTSMFEAGGNTGNIIVQVGQAIEWIYAPWLLPACTARIVSRSAPPGGKEIDSGRLGPSGRFHFVPDVAGTWVFTDTLNGGSGTLTAVFP
jgi:hypothetical protein